MMSGDKHVETDLRLKLRKPSKRTLQTQMIIFHLASLISEVWIHTDGNRKLIEEEKNKVLK